MRNNFEEVVFTTKEKRDEVYHDLRENGNANERQVVRFSGCREVSIGECWSTWSVAYPKELPERRVRHSKIHRTNKKRDFSLELVEA